MDNDNLEPIGLLLSQEELLLILQRLETNFIPGLDADFFQDLSSEQQTLIFQVAEHALRARQLVQLGGDGELEIHTPLLAAVGTCAYSDKIVFAYHWPTENDEPIRYFGHVREDLVVAHTRPADVLHLFTLLPSPEDLLEQVMTVCQSTEMKSPDSLELTIANEVFTEVRELVGAGNIEQALDLLIANRVTKEVAHPFIDTLVDSPQISVMQVAKQENGTAQKQDFTLLQGKHHWLAMPTEEGSSLKIKTTTSDELQELLRGWV